MIVSFTPEQAAAHQGQLSTLLIDAVDSGASVGFMPPLDRTEADAYWDTVIAAMSDGTRILLVSIEHDRIHGAVQIALETRANGNHRAEVIKLFVHREARRRGVAKALMSEVDATARRLGRTLLVLDTRKGGEAEKLFESIGYVRAGEIPDYARSSNGDLHTTVFFYRKLA